MAAIQIGVAMSGGVDSTMAASLLLERGYEVHGFFMQLPLHRQDSLLARARQVATHLGVSLHLIDLRQQFLDEVIDYFTRTYRAGLTPNPCIYCNRMIKFGLLAQAIRSTGIDQIATGHYASIVEHEGKRWIGRGQDPIKDQSYFLARLDAKQLPHLSFPLGSWSKAAIYERAHKLGFAFSGEESQDVCFLEQDLSTFLAEHGLGHQPGPVQTLEGKIIGEHQGIWRYTIGQRRGLGLPDATPWYVVGLDGPNNRVIVGKNDQLLSHDCHLHSLLFTHEPPPLPWRGPVQLRSRHRPATATLTSTGAKSWRLRFEEPQRAITPGQYAVLYEEDRVIASGIIAGPHQETQQ